MTTKHKRFRVTATVTFNSAITMAEARRQAEKEFGGLSDQIVFSFSIRGPFKATPFPKQVKRK